MKPSKNLVKLMSFISIQKNINILHEKINREIQQVQWKYSKMFMLKNEIVFLNVLQIIWCNSFSRCFD